MRSHEPKPGDPLTETRPGLVARLSAALHQRRGEVWLLPPLMVLFGGLWAVLKLGSEVREGETSGFDRAILLALRQPGHPDAPLGPRWLQESARDLTALGGFTVLTLVVLAALAVLVIYRRRRQALVFGAAVVLAQIAAEAVKLFIDRPRPDLVSHLDLTYSSSFPSGHAVMSPAVYFTLAAMVAAGELRPAARRLLIAGAAALVVVIGISRIYLGVHWPSDVLAGWTLGSAVAMAAWAALRRLSASRR